MSRLDYQPEIVHMSPDQLRECPDNDKIHTEEQIERLALIIKEHGFDQPIVADGEGEIIKGVGRLRAAKKIGLGLVPVIVRDDMTLGERTAARLADNHSASLEYDSSKTTKSIKTLQQLGVDLKLAGLQTKRLAKVQGHIRKLGKKPDESEEEKQEEPETLSKPGDQWLLGDHVLTCGAGDIAQCDIMVKAWEGYTKKKAMRHSDPITRKAEDKNAS